MLTSHVSTSAANAKAYFTTGLQRADYYMRDQGQEMIGQWHGAAAARLGLVGQVDQPTFFALADNRHPTTGETLTVRRKVERRAGMDITLSAPKSVSLLYEWTGDARILHAVRTSASETMQEMEKAVSTRVRRNGACTDRPTGNMVWADFVHFTSRPVNGVPDPNLHIHNFIFNTTWDPVEKRWKAAELYNLKRDAPYYEAAFHSRLAARMHALGYRIERDGKFWNVAGISRDLIEKFSRRTEQIEQEAEERGLIEYDAQGNKIVHNPAAVAELTTNYPGTQSRSSDAGNELRARWWERLTPHERPDIGCAGLRWRTGQFRRTTHHPGRRPGIRHSRSFRAGIRGEYGGTDGDSPALWVRRRAAE